MLNGMMGQKLGMTQIYNEKGKLVPVTIIQLGPCKIIQVKNIEKDGYSAAQIGFQEKKPKNVTKALMGHFSVVKSSPYQFLREFKGDLSDVTLGQVIFADLFSKGEKIDVQGVSIGKGFQGVMKRHHFSGGPATHGSMFHRAPGSIGASSFPSRVWKNQRMGGHMGNRTVTIQSLEVVEVRKDENILFVKGAVPGSKGSLLLLKKGIKQSGKVK
ncbi:MAG: 50S ribosomal protein L3 [Nitrospiria bacterium]